MKRCADKFGFGRLLTDLLYPRRCAICDEVLPMGEGLICRGHNSLPYVKTPSCMVCGKEVDSEERELCLDCEKHSRNFERGFPVFNYVEPVKASVLAIKYHNKKEYCDFYGAQMAEKVRPYVRRYGIDAVTCVPLHRRKQRQRGYNQAAVLAKVVHMFMKNRMNVVRGFFSDFIVRLVMFDHTFAFPRMIWYFALICLGFVNYPFSLIIQSVIIMYMLYVFTTALLYICISLFLKPFKKLRRYYVRKIYLIFLLPLYNFVVFWFRFAGIINSMKSKGSWKMQTFSDERDTAVGVVRSDFLRFTHGLDKVRRFVNYPEDELAGAHEETR